MTTTDAATGERVVLRSGSLVQALRASIALPFMFAPVHIDGRRLVDGFVTDPLPVSAAADAHAVLALGFESPMPHRVDGPSRLLAQVTSALTNNLMQARLAEASAGGTRLLSLVPQLERAWACSTPPPCPTWWRPAAAPPRRRCRPSTRCCAARRSWRWRDPPPRTPAATSWLLPRPDRRDSPPWSKRMITLQRTRLLVALVGTFALCLHPPAKARTHRDPTA